MIPEPTNSTEYQMEVLKKIKEVHESEADMSDRMLLMSIFENFRTGSGLRLSKFGFELCQEHLLYQFSKIPLTREFKSSIIFTSLDRICKSPYYVQGNLIYISDAIVVTELTFCEDDFKRLFEMYM